MILYGASPLLWKSKKHKSISLSTTDAEYPTATEVTREICWVLNLFRGLQLDVALPVTLFGDNENANNLANGASPNNRTRHIDIRQRYVSDKSAEGIIKVVWVPTIEQVADIFTKPLSRQTVDKLCTKIRVYLPQVSHVCTMCLPSLKSNNALHGHIRHNHLDIGMRFFLVLNDALSLWIVYDAFAQKYDAFAQLYVLTLRCIGSGFGSFVYICCICTVIPDTLVLNLYRKPKTLPRKLISQMG